MSHNLPEGTNKPEDVDLGQLFKLIGNAFERFFKFIGGILNRLFLAFVWLVFFLKKHALKILIAAVVGFGLGFAKDKLSEDVFSSNITIKQNYRSGENLYDLIEYYNSLLSQDRQVLSNALGMTEEQVESIISFEVKPSVSENLRLKGYNDYVNQLDSALAAGIDYEMYIENTMEWDYTYQKITISSDQPKSTRKIFDNVLEKINTTDYFLNEKKKEIEELQNREAAIRQSLKESEELRNTYKNVLQQQSTEKEKGSQTSITIEGQDRAKETKEFELFKVDLELRRELVRIERARQNLDKIIEVISSEFSNGVKDNNIEIFNISLSNKVAYALFFPLLTLLFLFGLSFMKYLENFKDEI